MFKDILKEKGRYSQGRVYLFWSVLFYYLTLSVLLWAGLSDKIDVELDKFKIILDALEYAISLFGGYVFGGKFISVFNSLKKETKKEPQSEE